MLKVKVILTVISFGAGIALAALHYFLSYAYSFNSIKTQNFTRYIIFSFFKCFIFAALFFLLVNFFHLSIIYLALGFCIACTLLALNV